MVFSYFPLNCFSNVPTHSTQTLWLILRMAPNMDSTVSAKYQQMLTSRSWGGKEKTSKEDRLFAFDKGWKSYLWCISQLDEHKYWIFLHKALHWPQISYLTLNKFEYSWLWINSQQAQCYWFLHPQLSQPWENRHGARPGSWPSNVGLNKNVLYWSPPLVP